MSTPKRVFFVASQRQGEQVLLTKSDSHHLKNVLRVEIGAQIELIERESGERFIAVLTSAEQASIIRRSDSKQILGRAGSIAFALCKGERNDLVVEKATELGVERIVLWQAERSIVRLENKPKEKLAELLLRWQRIAEGAAKQCGRNTVPEVSFMEDGKKLISHLLGFKKPDDIILVCSLTPEAQLAKQLELPDLNPATAVHLIVGPEGDMTADELQGFKAIEAKELSLGSLILRAETAAIAALAAVNAVWGERECAIC